MERLGGCIQGKTVRHGIYDSGRRSFATGDGGAKKACMLPLYQIVDAIIDIDRRRESREMVAMIYLFLMCANSDDQKEEPALESKREHRPPQENDSASDKSNE